MSDAISLLDQVRIASPCPMFWEQMEGGDKVRFCGQCKLNVYNLSAMTRREAEKVIREKEGRLCAGFYRRADGTVLTSNCPVGLRVVRRRLARCVGVIAAAVIVCIEALSFLGIGNRDLTSTRRENGNIRLKTLQPFKSICEKFEGTPPPPKRLVAGMILRRPGPAKSVTSNPERKNNAIPGR